MRSRAEVLRRAFGRVPRRGTLTRGTLTRVIRARGIPPGGFRADRVRARCVRTRGLSLIELLVALAVLSIGVLALALAQVGALRAAAVSDRLRHASSVVASEMADLRSVPRSLGTGPCQTVRTDDDHASWTCQVELVCARWVASACRVAAVKVEVVTPDDVVREAHGAVRWPAPGQEGPP